MFDWPSLIIAYMSVPTLTDITAPSSSSSSAKSASTSSSSSTQPPAKSSASAKPSLPTLANRRLTAALTHADERVRALAAAVWFELLRERARLTAWPLVPGMKTARVTSGRLSVPDFFRFFQVPDFFANFCFRYFHVLPSTPFQIFCVRAFS
jgi:hypothetical protein